LSDAVAGHKAEGEEEREGEKRKSFRLRRHFERLHFATAASSGACDGHGWKKREGRGEGKGRKEIPSSSFISSSVQVIPPAPARRRERGGEEKGKGARRSMFVTGLGKEGGGGGKREKKERN